MKLAICVPVHHRPESAEPFLDSLNDTTFARIGLYVVTSPGDDETKMAWLNGMVKRTFQGEVMDSNDESYPLKVEATYRHLRSLGKESPRFILLVGDDVRFHSGWYKAFVDAAAANPNAGLISTNDMGNLYVMRGTHATHPIFRVSYIETKGASWDGPGTIVHTGYRHSWCDEEWSVKAIHDGAFVYVPDCKIEHLHPTWNKGTQDATYQIARDHIMDDHDLYQRRHEHAITPGWA